MCESFSPEEDGTPRESDNPQASGWLEEIEELEADTEAQGSNGQPKERPPRKWDVYERILRVPYYVVFSRYTNRVRFFQLVGGRYQERAVDAACPQVWIPELEVGLGLWQGEFRGIERQWLRWYDAQGNWLLTDTEEERQRAEQAEALLAKERQRAEQERQQLLERLRARGINPDELLG